MNCPKCHSSLHEIRFEGVLVDFCDSCKGIWFDKDEMAFLLELSDDIPNVAEVEKDATETQYACPRCGEPRKLQEMKFVKADDLLIDRCPVCRGIWVDNHELPKMESIAAKIGNAKSKLMLASQQLKAKGYDILGIKA